MANEHEKENAAMAAMEYVEDGMTIGLGTGSTAKYFVEMLAEEVADGLVVRCIETSEQTRRLASSLGVPLIPFEQVERIHLTVDGADEVDPQGQLIKGGGAALLREKIIANASDHMVVIADPSKQVERLGKFPLPVEVTPFGYTITAKLVYDVLAASGIDRPRVQLRSLTNGELVVTDGGNHILDCHCERIPDAEALAARLSNVPGVVEHGLFIGLARTVIIGNENGATVFEFS
ncbi:MULTISPECIES: ribose-5-phosphate isomerase RpiA [unclassified Hyphomonas]|jgi:ribose 5-phosphate isomerase A|uniref:ribose-5-phosphate isomerase n=1 Tax=hydrothermal vent metagenome TaxID=652676 RepID=A0A160U261_9ZZZZ|nr:MULTISPECIES: ribose-5-phosphate isomerase RpiA [unclassified Hyphomonas]MAN90135.1 ribose-5-phosphate isomerase RpiA [Hyphomonadaceae bacterium]KCZ64001.1 ribose 5-phosphate isomerase [Hyphomonas sp. L-53-1-40]MAA80952.1 ribose-5-phosphate isomerase RpiA [Hyphomonas sp.]MAL43344.1 ribose-5-phosphate isomerase RpiA [Hyphomonas sp.]MAX82643.1 ribose-5-phosphate isomerase RpiA [Hyphomonas sp.]|tara:strand:- start:6482 stop:7183 length:702 start_codon:yes stop_codon:yes gene_type:complete